MLDDDKLDELINAILHRGDVMDKSIMTENYWEECRTYKFPFSNPSLTSGLYSIAYALHRIADAMEKDKE